MSYALDSVDRQIIRILQRDRRTSSGQGGDLLSWCEALRTDLVAMRPKTFLTIALLATLLMGCAPRPPSRPPFVEEIEETSTWYVDVERFHRSAHGTLTCAECHADITPGDAESPHPDGTKLTLEATSLYDYETCRSCHPQEYVAYEKGVHAQVMADPEGVDLDAPAPTCGHCHNAHYATVETRADLLASVSATCGECHLEALQTYQQNYHGKAALLGYEETATCADCHGAHTVLTLYDAEESVPACRRCHPKANDGFASYRIHAHETLAPDPDDPRASDFRLFFWVKLFFTVLVVAVLAFFYFHTGLWFLRSVHERLRGGHHD